MSAVDSSPMSVQAGAPERRRRTNLRQSLRAMRDNASTAYAPEDFSADIIKQRILWSRIFVINQPEGIRHILLDNAANYRKSEVGRRVLEPALGRGLLTSEGDTWRRHRRIMAPAFDRAALPATRRSWPR
jgi:cytochrome P450